MSDSDDQYIAFLCSSTSEGLVLMADTLLSTIQAHLKAWVLVTDLLLSTVRALHGLSFADTLQAHLKAWVLVS